MMTERIQETQEADGAESLPWRTVAHVLGLVVLVALVLPFVIYAVPGVVGAEGSYVVLSGSMEPTFGPGDVIVVYDVPASAISEGDVVTYGENEGEVPPTTHRVVEVVENEQGIAFRTKGDANEAADSSLVAAERVRGEVPTVGGHLFVIPLVGYVIRFAGTQLGLVALLIAPMTLLVLSEVYTVVRSTRGSGERGSDGGATPGEPTGTEDTTTAAPAAPNDDDADEDTGGFTLTPTDLQLTLAVLTLFTAYAVWVAVTTPEVWSVTVATTAGATLLLVGALYLFGGSPPDRSDDSSADDRVTAAVMPAGGLPPGRHEVALNGGARRTVVQTGGAPRPGSDETPREGPIDGLPPGSAVARTGTTGGTPTERLERPAPRPSAFERDGLVPAITPTDGDVGGSPSSTPGDSDPAVGQEGGGPQPPSDSPLITAPYVFLYYVGYAVVEPIRYVRRRLAAVGETLAGRTDRTERPTPRPSVSERDELMPAITPIERTERAERPAPRPSVSERDELMPAITPTDGDVGGSPSSTPGDSDPAVGQEGGGPQPPSDSPLITAPYVFLYYIGYVVVEPTRYVYRRLSAVGGGGVDG